MQGKLIAVAYIRKHIKDAKWGLPVRTHNKSKWGGTIRMYIEDAQWGHTMRKYNEDETIKTYNEDAHLGRKKRTHNEDAQRGRTMRTYSEDAQRGSTARSHNTMRKHINYTLWGRMSNKDEYREFTM